MSGFIQEPPVKAKPSVDLELLTSLHPELLNDSYVYVHCFFDNPAEGTLIRIWNSTFLVDRGSASRAKLVHAENISIAPLWTLIPDKQRFEFLLIFSSLPKSCTYFDLLEDIPQAGGFFVRNIARNESDVYRVEIR